MGRVLQLQEFQREYRSGSARRGTAAAVMRSTRRRRRHAPLPRLRCLYMAWRSRLNSAPNSRLGSSTTAASMALGEGDGAGGRAGVRNECSACWCRGHGGVQKAAAAAKQGSRAQQAPPADSLEPLQRLGSSL